MALSCVIYGQVCFNGEHCNFVISFFSDSLVVFSLSHLSTCFLKKHGTFCMAVGGGFPKGCASPSVSNVAHFLSFLRLNLSQHESNSSRMAFTGCQVHSRSLVIIFNINISSSV
jgi:hypothetical protein